MSKSGFQVTFDEIQTYDWQAVCAKKVDANTLWDVSTVFFERAAELHSKSDVVGEKVFRFLGAVTSLRPNFQSGEEPFRPWLIEPTRRSIALEDFNLDDAKVLGQLAAVARNPELRARFADVACSTHFDHSVARDACSAYLEAAKVREDCEKWVTFFHYIKRAVQLAAMLGKKQQPFLEATTYVEQLVAKYSPHDVGLCCARLLDLMIQFRFGDPAVYAPIAESLAERAEANEKLHFAESYWQLAAEWRKQADQTNDAQRCAIRAAETHVLEADAALGRKPSSYMASAGHLARAVEALRRSKAPKERVDEIHRRLLDCQAQSMAEMGSFSQEIEITELQQKARELVSGHDLREAIFHFTTGISPSDPKELRQEVERLAKDFPFQAIISMAAVDRQGRVVAQRPSMFTSNREQYEAAVQAEMFHHATTIDWRFRVQAFIEPCRQQIWNDHHPTLRDMHFFCSNNPFVPPGHEQSFVRGFHAGFEGDFHAAAYFLAPQVENSIRYVLENRGVITSKLDNKLVQEVRSLDTLLRMPETTDAFGEAHVFELRGLLTEEFGSNLRNRLAHGLLADGDCHSEPVLHLWWLLLRFCVVPLLTGKGGAPLTR